MKVKAVCALALVMGLTSCGGDGDGDGGDASTASSSTEAGAGSGNEAPQTGNITTIDNNPLKLSPAPVFTASSRSVTYDDCFPRHDDVQVGDIAVDGVEEFDSWTNQIETMHQTNTVTAVVPYSYAGRQGVLITDENPEHVSANGHYPKLVSEELSLRGARHWMKTTGFTTVSGNTVQNYTYTHIPLELGDISNGNAPYKPGDSTTSTFDWISQHGNEPPTTVRVIEKLTFLGVEEGTTVAGFSFPYACVFRVEIKSDRVTRIEDHYHHKYGGIKAVVYTDGGPKPLVNERLSDTARERRIKQAG